MLAEIKRLGEISEKGSKARLEWIEEKNKYVRIRKALDGIIGLGQHGEKGHNGDYDEFYPDAIAYCCDLYPTDRNGEEYRVFMEVEAGPYYEVKNRTKKVNIRSFPIKVRIYGNKGTVIIEEEFPTEEEINLPSMRPSVLKLKTRYATELLSLLVRSGEIE